MALRYHHKSRREESVLTSPLVRAAAVIAFALCFLAVLALVFVNGDRVKPYLEDALSFITESKVTIQSAEFSPLYPDTFKITNVSFESQDKTYTLQEGYLEMDLLSLLLEDRILVEDLYLRGADFPEDFLESTVAKGSQKGAALKSLRLDGFNLNKDELKSTNTYLRLFDVSLADGTLNFSRGSLSASEGSLLDLPFKNLTFSFTAIKDGFALEDLNIAILGGTATGRGSYNIKEQKLDFDELNLANMVLRNHILSKIPFPLESKKGYLTEVFIGSFGEKMLFSGVSGSYESLRVDPDLNPALSFKGRIAEISYPEYELTLTDNEGVIKAEDPEIFLDLKGSFNDGAAQIALSLDPDNRTLNVQKLMLSDNKLELKSKIADLADSILEEYEITISEAAITNAKLLSYLNFLPISAEKLSLGVSSIAVKKGRLNAKPTGLINFNAKNLLIQDLLVSEGTIIATITDNLITVSAPEINLKGSIFSLSASLAKNPNAQSYLLFLADNFDLASLNSSFFNHLFAGRINADISLSARGGDPEDLVKTISGSASITSDNLLISKFGLDLINGGSDKPANYDLNTLLSALADQDSGIFDLDLNVGINEGQVQVKGNFELPVSKVAVNHSLNLQDLSLKGSSTFISRLQDSITLFRAGGTLTEPVFSIIPRKRGQKRPGLGDSLASQQEKLVETVSEDRVTSQETGAVQEGGEDDGGSYDPKDVTKDPGEGSLEENQSEPDEASYPSAPSSASAAAKTPGDGDSSPDDGASFSSKLREEAAPDNPDPDAGQNSLPDEISGQTNQTSELDPMSSDKKDQESEPLEDSGH